MCFMKNLFLIAILGLGLCSLAAAGAVKPPWAPAYAGTAAALAKGAAAPRAYQDTRHLLSSTFLQHLDQETIAAARQLVAASLQVDPVSLPDGSELAGFPAATQGADLYRITYQSVTAAGKPTVVSGLVAVPASDAAGGIVVYMHATTAERHNPPSELPLEAFGALTAFSGNDWVVVLPDYLGYGVNHDPHPFALGRLNAPAGRDIIPAVRELLSRLGRQAGSDLFVTGYSEGGGNALWLGRLLQEGQDPTLRPQVVAAMSGPYDISGATARSFQEEQPGYVDNLVEKPFFMAFAGVGAAQVTGQPLDTLLRPEFARATAGLLPGLQWDEIVEGQLLSAAILQSNYLDIPTLDPKPTRLLQPGFMAAMNHHDRNNPTIRLWMENDNLDWTPTAPVYLLGVIQDAVVPFAGKGYPLPPAYGGIGAPYSGGNAENLIRSMRARGVDHTRIAWMGFDGAAPGPLGFPIQTMSHDEAFVPCVILAARSFRAKRLAGLPMIPDPK